jgi:hypothetical protein
MKRIIWVAAIMAVVCSALPAAADFYVIGGGGKAGTQITSVPYTIDSPGLYCLARNLTYSATTGNAITVNASGVTLDLMGFSLTGPGKTSGTNFGIRFNPGLANVEIRNGTVASFGYLAIYDSDSQGSRLIGLRIRDNGATGVEMDGNNQVVMGCSFLDNGGKGAIIQKGLIKGNLASNNGSNGMNAGVGSTISGNMCHSNGGKGINAYGGNLVLDNTVTSNGNYGIQTGDGCTVTGNTCRGNTSVGIYTGANCLITNNTTQGVTVGADCVNTNNCRY